MNSVLPNSLSCYVINGEFSSHHFYIGVLMKSSKITFIYFSLTSVMSGGLILLLLNILNWPVIASVAFGSALYIHSIFLSRQLKDLFLKAYEKGLVGDLIFYLKGNFELPDNKSESEF